MCVNKGPGRARDGSRWERGSVCALKSPGGGPHPGRYCGNRTASFWGMFCCESPLWSLKTKGYALAVGVGDEGSSLTCLGRLMFGTSCPHPTPVDVPYCDAMPITDLLDRIPYHSAILAVSLWAMQGKTMATHWHANTH